MIKEYCQELVDLILVVLASKYLKPPYICVKVLLPAGSVNNVRVYIFKNPCVPYIASVPIDTTTVFMSRLEYITSDNYSMYVSRPSELPSTSFVLGEGSDYVNIRSPSPDYSRYYLLSGIIRSCSFILVQQEEAYLKWLSFQRQLHVASCSIILPDSQKKPLSEESTYSNEPSSVFVEAANNYVVAKQILQSLDLTKEHTIYAPGDGCGLLLSAYEIMMSYRQITIDDTHRLISSDKYCGHLKWSKGPVYIDFLGNIAPTTQSVYIIFLHSFWFHTSYILDPGNDILFRTSRVIIVDLASPKKFIGSLFGRVCDERYPGFFCYGFDRDTIGIEVAHRGFSTTGIIHSPVLYQPALHFKKYVLTDQYTNVILLSTHYRLTVRLEQDNCRAICFDKMGSMKYLSFPNSIQDVVTFSDSDIITRHKRVLFWSSSFLKIISAKSAILSPPIILMNYDSPMYIYDLNMDKIGKALLIDDGKRLVRMQYSRENKVFYYPNVLFRNDRFFPQCQVKNSHLKSILKTFPLSFVQCLSTDSIPSGYSEMQTLSLLTKLFDEYQNEHN